MELACCHIDEATNTQCAEAVEYEINVEDAGLHPSENFLHSCVGHVGALLTVPAGKGLESDKVRYLVTPIEMVPTWA